VSGGMSERVRVYIPDVICNKKYKNDLIFCLNAHTISLKVWIRPIQFQKTHTAK